MMSTVLDSAEGETRVQSVPEANVQCVGLATRVISFALDAAVINLVAIIVGIGAALILSVLHLPKDLRTLLIAIGGAAYVLGSIAYFVGFWSAAGQTPGARAMQLRVVTARGERVKPRRALLRCIGVVLAALPLFAGFLLILFDRRRRGFQDLLAGTLVVDAPDVSFAETRRARKRAEYESSKQRPPAALP